MVEDSGRCFSPLKGRIVLQFKTVILTISPRNEEHIPFPDHLRVTVKKREARVANRKVKTLGKLISTMLS